MTGNHRKPSGGSGHHRSHIREESPHVDVPQPSDLSARRRSSRSSRYGQHETHFHQHPRRNHDRSVDENSEKSSVIHHPMKAKALSSSGSRENSPRPSSNRGDSRVEINTNINLEVRVSVAAKQLDVQIRESTEFWTKFQTEYREEVQSIEPYVENNILEDIWRARTKYDGEGMNEEQKQDFEQFDIHRMKLEACLDQLSKATKALAQSHISSDRSSHDSRQLSLKKIWDAGSLALELAVKAVSNSAACLDLIAEGSRLEKLVDPKGPDARMLHQFDTLEISKEPKGESEKGPRPVETDPPYSQSGDEMERGVDEVEEAMEAEEEP
ncbi:hypothetical protein F5Y04DRAFT_250416 [Hypomontagnella monticulosa]|nr:hypothetical protein F5Y04DRAFT_250416 [Hypomontagnella monticulosa]